MFRTVTIWALCVMAAAAALHWVWWLIVHRGPARRPRGVPRYTWVERLIHLGLTVSFLTLAGTGFYATICTGEPMTGYLLMAHTTCGGMFAFFLILAAVVWAHDNRFAAGDGQWMKACGGYCTGRSGLPAGRFDAAQKVHFWLMLAGGIVLVLTPALSMLDWFGTEGQELLYEVHRWAALVLAVVVVEHAYFTGLVKRGGLWSMVGGTVSREWARRYHPQWPPPETEQEGES